MIAHVLEKQRDFDFSYYLQKNAPLPSDWKNRKKELVEISKTELRPVVFRELFDHCNCSNDEVVNFLEEYTTQVFPKDFLTGCSKNKKVFRQKLK